jgi:hypothetical protein
MKERRIHEIRRQRDFEGVEDPEERRAIARAHQQERDNERVADRKTDEFIASTKASAPKKRKVKGINPFKPSAFSSHRGFSSRPRRGIASFLATGEKDEQRSPRNERSESSSAPKAVSSSVTGSQRKAHKGKLEQDETKLRES